MNEGKLKVKQKGKGGWSEIEKLSDPKSNLAVVISERVRDNKPEYTIQFVLETKAATNRFIPWPIEGAENSLKDIMFSLASAAEDCITKRILDTPDPEEEADKPGKKTKLNENRPQQRKGQGGLSTLAKKDAEAKGFERGSQTERKRKKRPGAS